MTMPIDLSLWDALVEQGIGQEWPDEDVILRVSLLTALAAKDGDKSKGEVALEWHSTIKKRTLSNQHAARLDYSWANALAGDRYGTHWRWEQPTLSSEIYLLRRSVSNQAFLQLPHSVQCETLNNLGNRLEVSGRTIEALEMWRRALMVMPNFGMALWNRACALVAYSHGFPNSGKEILLWWAAHRDASSALENAAFYSTPEDKQRASNASTLIDWIEAKIDVRGIDSSDPLAWPDSSLSEEERNYRRWCLENTLFLNEANDIGPYWIATIDSLALAEHAVDRKLVGIFEGFFDQLKQEYVSARWALYQGVTSNSSHFSDRDVLLHASLENASLSLSIEREKAAYRAAYCIFDKVAFFVCAYMELPIRERDVTFRTLWVDKDLIRPEFDSQYNWAFCALFWMAKDFSEKTTDEVAEPEARNLIAIRNHLEHKYLRITKEEPVVSSPADFAHVVSRTNFEGKTKHLLKLARAALIYLAIGVGFEEQRRAAKRPSGVMLVEVPSTPILPDEEKT